MKLSGCQKRTAKGADVFATKAKLSELKFEMLSHGRKRGYLGYGNNVQRFARDHSGEQLILDLKVFEQG